MITRITIKSESGYGPADSACKDRLTITRSSVRYESTNPRGNVSPEKWTVTNHSAAFNNMFLNLCAEVEQIMTLPEAPLSRDAGTTTFVVMEDTGTKRERTLSEPDERYTIIFTIIDQMVKSCRPFGHRSGDSRG